jgi:uncharacterized damage-inducible protein DinB
MFKGRINELIKSKLARQLLPRRVQKPEEFEQALAHSFNDQTHHRGHVHALLTGLPGEAPELGLLHFQRLTAKSAA